MFQTISRVDLTSLTPDIFRDQYRKEIKPVVITGLLDEDGEWNIQFLAEKLGDHEFNFRDYGKQRNDPQNKRVVGVGSGTITRRMRFSDYEKMLRSGEAREQDIYMAKCSLKDTPLGNPKFSTKMREQLGLTEEMSDLSMYTGPEGHTTNLHYDPFDNILMQLSGVKKIILFPPSQLYNLYPNPVIGHLLYGRKLGCWYSQVNLTVPDLKKFPKLQEALQHQYEVILCPGDSIYMPAGWWHEITIIGDSMAASVRQLWKTCPRMRGFLSLSRWRVTLGFLLESPHTGRLNLFPKD